MRSTLGVSARGGAAFAAALLLLPCSLGLGAPEAAPKPVTHTVRIDATRFQPATLTVKAGDAIVWINEDFFPHTATSKGGGFDSGAILSGKSWTFTAKAKGDISYICTFHPTTMKGTLRVK